MAYDYIERHYGTRFTPGMRVKFTECGGKFGKVKRSMTNLHYVSVKFDDGNSGYCHPDSLEIQPTASEQERPPK